MKVAAHGYISCREGLAVHLCWSGTSLFEILDPPLRADEMEMMTYAVIQMQRLQMKVIKVLKNNV